MNSELSASQLAYNFTALVPQTLKIPHPMSSASGGHTSHSYMSNQRSHSNHTRGPIPRLLSFLANSVVGRCIFPTAPRSSAPTEVDGPAEDSVMGEHSVCIQEEQGDRRCIAVSVTIAYRSSTVGRVTVAIDILPDEVLLEIFRFYQVGGSSFPPHRAQKRHALLHVCRRWRAIVFASPGGLHLRVLCTARTQVKEMLDAWPTVPIEIWGSFFIFFTPPSSGDDRADNIIAALQHNDRVCKIELEGYPEPLERIAAAAATKGPFPGLTHLRIDSPPLIPLVIPEAFLGGSAPRLRSCIIVGHVKFWGLWKLLSTSNHLVILLLNEIPPTTCISPEAMVTLLSGMPKLEELFLLFWWYLGGQTNQHPPIQTHVVLPALTRFWFHGYSDYIEDLCSRINAPLLDNFSFSFFYEPYHTPQIRDFLNRSTKLPEAHDQWPVTPESLEYYHKRLW